MQDTVSNGEYIVDELRSGYFPAALEHIFGPLPTPETSERHGAHMFPHNVSFRTADWAKDPIPEDEQAWDVIVAYAPWTRDV